MMRRHVRKEVGTSGDDWKAEDRVLFSTHIPSCHYRQFSKVRLIDLSCSLLLSSLSPLLFRCRISLIFKMEKENQEEERKNEKNVFIKD